MGSFSLKGAADVAARQDRGTRVALRDEHGDPLTYTNAEGEVVESTALVAGQLSSLYRKAEDALRDRQLKRRSTVLTAELLNRQQLELIAACVLKWDLFDEERPVPCTKENVITVLIAAPWIRADIEAAMADAARFLG